MDSYKSIKERAAVNMAADRSYASRYGAGGKTVRREKKRFKRFSLPKEIDFTFCALLLLLIIIGLAMLFTASYPISYYEKGNSYHYLLRQLLYIAIGGALMIGITFFDYHILHYIAIPFVVFTAILLGIALVIPSAIDVHRWIYIGSLQIQPSEIAKFALILFMADWASKNFSKMGKFGTGVLIPLLVTGLLAGLTIIEPHFSGAVIIILIAGIMMFLGGVKLRYFAILGGLLVTAVLVLIATGMGGYALERLDGMGQALTTQRGDPLWDKIWQTRNSLFAIGSGGPMGLGLGKSHQKYLFLPEPQNDFIFAVVCEELGLLGASIILILFALLVFRGITISRNAKDKFGSLLGMGIAAQLGVQIILNILVITDWMPNTGISLPFFSSGGSSLIVLMGQMGVLLSVSRNSVIEKE